MTLPIVGVVWALLIFFCALWTLRATLAHWEPVVGPWLRRAVGRPWKGVLWGFLVTAIVQSSSAVNSVTVALVGAGVLGLPHAFAIVLGANVGTTMTGQLIALSAYSLALPMFCAGLLLQLAASERVRLGGHLLASLGGLFYGLWALGEALLRVGEGNVLSQLIAAADYSPAVALVTGVFLTALVQSSSAVTGLLIGLAGSGVIAAKTGIAAALGSNVGTVATTILASIPAGAAARRVAWMDLVFNLTGALLFFPLLTLADEGWLFALATHPGRQVANAHTFFNLITVLAALPWIGPLGRWIERGVRRV